MERLESIFDSIKERLTNPFIFSFIAAWLTFNWEVTLALFWFDSADLKTKGHSNLIDFISTNTNNWSWGVPVLIAIAYTFGMPLFKMGFEWFNALVLKWTNSTLFKISEETPVSYGKYFELKKEHKKLIEELASDVNTASQRAQEYADIQKRMTETESSYGSTINDLKNQIKKVIDEKEVLQSQQATLVAKINSIQSELDDCKKDSIKNRDFVSRYNDVKLLNGRWEFQYDNKIRNLNFSEKIEIIDGVIYSITGSQGVSTLRTMFFFNDILSKEIVLILEFVPNTPEWNYLYRIKPIANADTADVKLSAAFSRARNLPVIIQKLKWKEDMLFGTENVEAIVSYEKLGGTRVLGAKD